MQHLGRTPRRRLSGLKKSWSPNSHQRSQNTLIDARNRQSSMGPSLIANCLKPEPVVQPLSSLEHGWPNRPRRSTRCVGREACPICRAAGAVSRQVSTKKFDTILPNDKFIR